MRGEFEMCGDVESVDGVSFDLFGTLVAVNRPDNPADAVAVALEERGVSVPDDWPDAYDERHLDCPPGAELSLPEHVAAALASRSPPLDRTELVGEVAPAVRSAFDAETQIRDGAVTAVNDLAKQLPVGVLSNCSVPGLAERTIGRSSIDGRALDTVTTSVGCGWRKPDPRAFRAVARNLGVGVERLLHVGDDSVADGGAADAEAAALLTDEVSLANVPTVVEERWG